MKKSKSHQARSEFPVVALGASAGGLEAVQHLLEAIPDKTGMAFILIQHLFPDHVSMMAELLAGRTQMAVAQAVEGERIEPDHLYLIPPGKLMSLVNGELHLEPARAGQALRLPFDHLLRSMAVDLGTRAVAVVLTGTGADGSGALEAIRKGGGKVFVQDPDEAAFDGMVRAALATGQVTRTETLAGLAKALIAHAATGPNAKSTAKSTTEAPGALAGIVALLRSNINHDFSHYKTGTLQRRIEQRISLLPVARGDLAGYLSLLETDSNELERLSQNLFINVTEFFRDAEVFALLEADTVPAMIESHTKKEPIRIWVVGCSTGQEAYSLAMLFSEVIEDTKAGCKVQIFASDVDTSALATARDGYFVDTTGVSKARLERHFVVEGPGFRIKPDLRARVTFAQHDVLTDPPFGRLDFLSCRNVMIYLDAKAQEKILGSFHFALVTGGLLLLGIAETAGAKAKRFLSVSESARLYRNQTRPGAKAKAAARSLDAPASAGTKNASAQDPSHQFDRQSSLPSIAVAHKPAVDPASLPEALQALELSRVAQNAMREDALSVAEEYQAANEELLASKEELQSLNEELTALNSQLQETLETQRATSDDMQNVLYSTNVATLFLDADLQIRFFTPAVRALFSLRPGDIGRPLADLAPLSTDRELFTEVRAVLAGKPSAEQEIEARAGTWYNRRVLPYLTSGGKVAGVVITFSDYTERRKTAEALATAERAARLASDAKTRFLAVASHDLRQPLQTMAILQGLLATAVSDPRSGDLVSRLGETLAAMARMLDVLLDMNQIEAGAIRAEKTRFPINEIFERLQAEFSYSARAKGVQLRILRSNFEVNSDPSLLEQMLRNLLSNALKYTNKGKVLIGCRRRGKSVLIGVWDTGIGIAEAETEAIFEEYHQINNPARERSLGLGLGLSIVKRLGDLLAHRIGVVSVVGRGSAFTIMIDEVMAQSTGQPVKPSPTAPKQAAIAAVKALILVVEDDPEVRDLLDIVLRGRGHETVLAEDGPSVIALMAAGAIRPDLLLTDYNLPGGLNGLELVAAMRHEFKIDVPAIVLTGDISQLSMRRISQQNVQHLAKPVTVERLHLAVADLLGEVSAKPAKPAKTAKPAAPAAPGTVNTGTVFVVDDDDMVRLALCELLREAGHTVHDYPTGEAFLAAYEPGSAGCLLIDAYLPGISGIDLLKQLKGRAEPLVSIMITGHSDVTIAVEAMKAGAADFVEKPVAAPELLTRVSAALASTPDSDDQMDARRSKRANLATLTPRQRQVLDAVLAGKASKVIAFELGISQRTVESHRAAIMEKLGAASVPALVRAALGVD